MSRNPYTTEQPDLEALLNQLIAKADIHSDPELFREMLVTVLKFAQDKPHPKDIKLFNNALKEMRYASKVFQPYEGVKKISVFGSARTHESTAEYQTAESFSRLMMESGYMVITGGGHGIMGAAQAGAGRERGFALNIQLPFEQHPNSTIAGDPKLINFRYFFTRKLNFVKNSNAIALFPGGFGTMDEGFEAITLIQTGKAPIIPIILVDAPGGNFWKTFHHYIQEHLLNDGLISAEDFHLFKLTDNINDARKEVTNFYYNFHSYRYVGDELVIRTQREIPPAAVTRLLEDFHDILTEKDSLRSCTFLPEEINEPEIAHLPRLCLKFNRRNHGRLRQLIDRLNFF
jgi:uncharacterized protein (TIGR00730 family)